MVSVRQKVAAAAVLCSITLHAETRRALLIGINTYEPPPSATAVEIHPDPAVRTRIPDRPIRSKASFRNLGGAVNDANEMRPVLIERFGFLPANIRMLTDRSATRAAILESIQTALMPDAARAGDVSVLFFAGHGSQVLNSKSREADHLDESLVPADSYAGVPDIRDKEIARLLNRMIDRGIVVTFIADSCHSGSIARGISVSRSRLLPFDPRDAKDPGMAGRSLQERGALILSATQETQEAKELSDGTHGVFTWALLKTLRSVSPGASADQIYQQTRAWMQSQAQSQANRVVLEGSLAALLNPGCELNHGKAVVRVTRVLSLTQVEAELVEGTAEKGASFGLSRWVVPDTDALRVLVSDAAGLPSELIRRIQQWAKPDGSIRVVASQSANPHYLLVGRRNKDVLECAWVAPDASDDVAGQFALPVRTDWVPVDPIQQASARLEQYALRIQRIRAWLQLASPPGAGSFAYTLAMKNTATDAIKTEGTLIEGEQYRLALRADPTELGKLQDEGLLNSRYVYVFSIDRAGNSVLLFPPGSTGNKGNLLPRIEGGTTAPAFIELGQEGETIQIAAPFGVDTYVLLATATPLPDPGVLTAEGVSSSNRRGSGDSLEDLLAGLGSPGTRGPMRTPAKWSVTRYPFRSVAR